MFVMEIHTSSTYLGIKLIDRTLVSYNLAGKNMLLIEHIIYMPLSDCADALGVY